jgi:hypothetical protein
VSTIGSTTTDSTVTSTLNDGRGTKLHGSFGIGASSSAQRSATTTTPRSFIPTTESLTGTDTASSCSCVTREEFSTRTSTVEGISADLATRLSATELLLRLLESVVLGDQPLYLSPSLLVSTCPEMAAGQYGADMLKADLRAGVQMMSVETHSLAQLGTPFDDWVLGLATFENDTYVTGLTYGDLDDNKNAGGSDAFLVRLAANGTKLWTTLLGTSADERGWGVAANPAGVFVSGHTKGALSQTINQGGQDVFIARYDHHGARVWIEQFGGGSSDDCSGVAVDDKVVYVAGQSNGAFLAGYDLNSTRLWFEKIGSTGSSTSVAVSGNAVFVTGWTSEALGNNTQLGVTDIFVARYTTSGALTWVQQFGSTGADYARGIMVDSGAIFVTGSVAGPVGEYAYAGGQDVIVARLSAADGSITWARQVGTPEEDIGWAIAVGSGSVVVTGSTGGALTGRGGGSAGGTDVFVIQYTMEGLEVDRRQLGTKADDAGRGVAIHDGRFLLAADTHGQLFGSPAGGQDSFVVSFALRS